MGQDREYSDEERKLALRAVREYASTWADSERKNLESDVNLRIEQISKDREYREMHEQIDVAELEKAIEA